MIIDLIHSRIEANNVLLSAKKLPEWDKTHMAGLAD